MNWLGTYVSLSGSNLPEIQMRCSAAVEAFEAFNKLFRRQRVPFEHKRIAFHAVVLGTLFVGLEARGLSASEERHLDKTQERLGRRVLGAEGYGLIPGVTEKRGVSGPNVYKRLRLSPSAGTLGSRRLVWFKNQLIQLDQDGPGAAPVLASLVGQIMDSELRALPNCSPLLEDGTAAPHAPPLLHALNRDLCALGSPLCRKMGRMIQSGGGGFASARKQSSESVSLTSFLQGVPPRWCGLNRILPQQGNNGMPLQRTG